MRHLLFIVLTFNAFNLIFSQVVFPEIITIQKKVITINSSLSDLKKIESQKDNLGLKKICFNDTFQKIEILSIEATKIEKRVAWFYYNKFPIYIEKIWTDLNLCKIIDNERIYIHDMEIILWLDFNNKAVDLTTSDNKTVCEKVISYSRNLIQNIK